jgi:hypothetical protein
VHAGRVDPEAGPALALGRVHRQVGVAQQVACRGLAVGEGDAHAHAHREHAAVDVDGGGQGGDQPVGDAAGVVDTTGARHQQRELVAAEPGGHVVGPHPARHAFRERHQHPVAGEVAEAVVDGLEVVHVHEHQRVAVRDRALGEVLGHELGEALHEPVPVRQAGQRVGERLVAQVGLEPAERGHVTEAPHAAHGAPVEELGLGDALEDPPVLERQLVDTRELGWA